MPKGQVLKSLPKNPWNTSYYYDVSSKISKNINDEERYYLGGRSIGSRRNFSSSIESKKDRPNSSYTTVVWFWQIYLNWNVSLLCLGYCCHYLYTSLIVFFMFKQIRDIFFLFHISYIKNAIPKWKKIEEHQLVKQRLLELPLKVVAELRNKLTSEEKFP